MTYCCVALRRQRDPIEFKRFGVDLICKQSLATHLVTKAALGKTATSTTTYYVRTYSTYAPTSMSRQPVLLLAGHPQAYTLVHISDARKAADGCQDAGSYSPDGVAC